MGAGISDVIFSCSFCYYPTSAVHAQQPGDHHNPDSEFGRKEMEMASLPASFGTRMLKMMYLEFVKVSEKLIQS